MSYVKRIVNINVEENRSKPIFKKEYLEFYRLEKAGYITIISKKHPEIREIMINPIGNYILSQCNGENYIKDICKNLYNNYANIKYQKICDDVCNILFQYDKIGIISWKGDNPFMANYKRIIDENRIVINVNENQINELFEFIKQEHNNMIEYCIPYKDKNSYDELKLRNDLFSYSEEYFFLKKNNKISGVISFIIPLENITTVSRIGIIICNKEDLKDILKYSMEILKDICIKELTKIVYIEKENELSINGITDIIKEVGYTKESYLVKEINDINLIRYTYVFK